MSSIALAVAATGLVASLAGTGVSLMNAAQADRTQATNVRRQGQLAAEQRKNMLRRQKMVQEQQGQDEQARAKQQALLDQNMQDASKAKFDQNQQAEQDRLSQVLAGQADTAHAPAPVTPNAAVANLATGNQSGGTASIVDAIDKYYKDQTAKEISGMAGNMAFGTGMADTARKLGQQTQDLQFMGSQRQTNRQSLGAYGAGMDSANAALSGAISTIGNSYIPVNNTLGNTLSGLGNMALQYGAYGMGQGSSGSKK
jgi:hypothetical protein